MVGSPLGTHGKKQCKLVVCGLWRPVRLDGVLRTGSWSDRTARSTERQQYVRAHAAPQGMCENLINSLKLLTNQQKDGDSPVCSQHVVAGSLEKSRKGIMDGLRKFIAVDTHEAVKVDGLRRGI